VQQERKAWSERQQTLNVEDLIFLDESSVNCGMTRLYGRAPTDERINDYVPDVRFERESIISGMSLNGIQAPMQFSGTLNGNVFTTYVKECLAPTLRPGNIVLMDSLSSHKVSGALDPIYEKGATVLFIPRYSPDYNPIELAWSKVKSILRKLKPRSKDELLKCMKTALDSITTSDIKGWFSHHGYVANV
jgi:transposase